MLRPVLSVSATDADYKRAVVEMFHRDAWEELQRRALVAAVERRIEENLERQRLHCSWLEERSYSETADDHQEFLERSQHFDDLAHEYKQLSQMLEDLRRQSRKEG